MPNIIFVDENDEEIGSGTKREAIQRGFIHRIVRIFVLNEDSKLLIQKRSKTVDVPDRWDQSAAGHVDEGENYLSAAKRELQEEVGVSDSVLEPLVKFYSEETDDNVTRKRFNMLYKATYSGEITFDPEEVSEVKWISLDNLDKWMEDKPRDFTNGFLVAYKHFRESLN